MIAKIPHPKLILMTKVGFERLTMEKQELEGGRPEAVLDLKKAREMGDLSENGYYKSARFKLSSIDARLRYLAHVLRYAKVQEIIAKDVVDIGVTVQLEGPEGEVIYTIVGEHEANPSDKKISHLSPLGRALLGKKNGEEATIVIPSGQKSYKIKKSS